MSLDKQKPTDDDFMPRALYGLSYISGFFTWVSSLGTGLLFGALEGQRIGAIIGASLGLVIGVCCGFLVVTMSLILLCPKAVWDSTTEYYCANSFILCSVLCWPGLISFLSMVATRQIVRLVVN
jgi:hypothetical protein